MAHEVSWTSLDFRQCVIGSDPTSHRVGIRLSQPTGRQIRGRYGRESEWDYTNYLGERVQEKYCICRFEALKHLSVIGHKQINKKKKKCKNCNFRGTTASHWGGTLKWTNLYLI